MIDREQEPNANDSYDGSEEQARGYALMATGQAAAAVPIFDHLLQNGIKRWGDDSAGLLGPLLLDLIAAQTQAGESASNSIFHLRSLCTSDRSVSCEDLRLRFQHEGSTPGIYSAYRSQMELGTLQAIK